MHGETNPNLSILYFFNEAQRAQAVKTTGLFYNFKPHKWTELLQFLTWNYLRQS